MEIKLTQQEMELGASVGCNRIISNMFAGRPLMPNKCPDHEAWLRGIEGAWGEIACAKFLKIEWDAGYKGSMDVGPYDVRATTYPDGKLLLQKWDKPRVNILVTGKAGTYRVAGYLFNSLGVKAKYWDESMPRPCYSIPQSDLEKFTTMENLEKYLALETERHRCAVRQLLKWHFAGNKQGIAEFVKENTKDNPIYQDFLDQGKKGNKGHDGVWL